ncbi:MAG: hypothetical protein KAI14_02610 [Dehalococcoidales bacterium]|nr:hypothetical protein [Dehalococcoidales bacterium]
MHFELHGDSKKSVIVEGSDVKIVRRVGIFSRTREIIIPISQIAFVEVKEPGAVWAGFIRFSTSGDSVKDSALSFTGGIFTAAKDVNTVLFTDQESCEMAMTIKRYVENYSEAPSKSRYAEKSSIAREMRRSKRFLQAGILTKAEYEEEIAQLADL